MSLLFIHVLPLFSVFLSDFFRRGERFLGYCNYYPHDIVPFRVDYPFVEEEASPLMEVVVDKLRLLEESLCKFEDKQPTVVEVLLFG